MSTAKNSAKARWIDETLGRLTLDQKIGQLFVFPFYGTFISPDIRELIMKHHLGGLRIAEKFAAGMSGHRTPGLSWHEKHSMAEPDALTFDCPPGLERTACTAAEFAATLNELRDMAMERPAAVPIHTAFDQEGEGADLLFEQRLLPFPMGLRASGDPGLAYRAAKAIARQAHAVGANMIHSPVLDVNTNRKNPEIGPRAYSEITDEVTRYALEALRGFTEERITATGKHFPGRGASDSDAHFGLPVIDLDGETMRREHIAPFKALIDAGLPAIMAAFTAYPGLGSSEPAATAPEIIQGLLRGELGFRGVVTTDNCQMGGLLEKFPIGEAVVRCLTAGCDLVLCRAYTPVRFRVIEAVQDAVKEGRITEERLDESVQRILAMRWDMGLAENGGKVDPAKAGGTFYDPEVLATVKEAAERSVVVLRDRDELIPLPTGRRVLLVEQIHHFHGFINNTYSHPGMLWQELLRVAPDVAAVHINEKPTKEDIEAVRSRLDWADIVVATCYYNYRSGARMTPVLDVLKASGKPVILVANTPYPDFGPTDDFGTVLVSFCPSGRENLAAVASVLAGQLKSTGQLPMGLGKARQVA